MKQTIVSKMCVIKLHTSFNILLFLIHLKCGFCYFCKMFKEASIDDSFLIFVSN